MDHRTRSAKVNSKISRKPLTQAAHHASKKRKVDEKIVVRVKIEGDPKKQKTEGPPTDCWSWRKYGQKPIKGSPYPRGYYRCSTSKGCAAKKQVERCSTDPSMLMIAYTSTHNHSGPDLPSTHHQVITQEHYLSPPAEENPTTPKQEEEQEEENDDESVKQEKLMDIGEENHLHYCRSPIEGSDLDMTIVKKEENLFSEGDLGAKYECVVVNQEPLSYPHRMTFSNPEPEENDFYDELEELPTSSFFASFMRKNLLDKRILISPS